MSETLTTAEDAVRALRVMCTRLDCLPAEKQSPEPVDMVLWADERMQGLERERDRLRVVLEKIRAEVDIGTLAHQIACAALAGKADTERGSASNG